MGITFKDYDTGIYRKQNISSECSFHSLGKVDTRGLYMQGVPIMNFDGSIARIIDEMTFAGHRIKHCDINHFKNEITITMEIPSTIEVKHLYPEPKRVIRSGKATIVLWKDDTKTIVKCSQEDDQNDAMGYMMCFMKKLYGSKFRKHIDWGKGNRSKSNSFLLGRCDLLSQELKDIRRELKNAYAERDASQAALDAIKGE